jgi:hypothetical protein
MSERFKPKLPPRRVKKEGEGEAVDFPTMKTTDSGPSRTRSVLKKKPLQPQMQQGQGGAFAHGLHGAGSKSKKGSFGGAVVSSYGGGSGGGRLGVKSAGTNEFGVKMESMHDDMIVDMEGAPTIELPPGQITSSTSSCQQDISSTSTPILSYLTDPKPSPPFLLQFPPQALNLNELQEGQLGEWIVYASGRMVFQLNNGTVMEVFEGVPVGFWQELMVVDNEKMVQCGRVVKKLVITES